jgi:hypothetical protein
MLLDASSERAFQPMRHPPPAGRPEAKSFGPE